MRGVVGEQDPAAAGWIEGVERRAVEGLCPELAFAEVANALAVSVRGGKLTSEEAEAALAAMIELRLRAVSLRELTGPAFSAALERGVTVYDACYLVLAEAAEATLVTADRRLAKRAARSALLPGTGPPDG